MFICKMNVVYHSKKSNFASYYHKQKFIKSNFSYLKSYSHNIKKSKICLVSGFGIQLHNPTIYTCTFLLDTE